jgi:hypothetical protein
MHPATFGVEQAASGQGDAGDGFGLVAVQQVQQAAVERRGQFGLALGFLGVEGQLQHAAGVPAWPRCRRCSQRRV